MKTINFLKHKNIILAISILVVLAGLIYGVITDYVFDIDFKGGTRIKVDFNEEYQESDIKDIVSTITNQVPELQTSSSGNNALTITTQTLSEDESNALIDALREKYTNMGEPTIRNVYVAVRLRTLGYAAAFSAILGLIFDVSFLFAIYGVFKFPINSTFVAVLLTIVGYSINDTIIVYDRIRENRRLVTKSEDPKDVINHSITQTMKRTIITSLTTLVAIGVVLIFALAKDQETLKQFSIPLAIGIAEGTFSSIFVATSIWYSLDRFINKHKKAKNK